MGVLISTTGGAGAEHLLQRLEIGLKVRHLRGHDGQFRTGASHIRPVFREVGGKGDTCSPGVLMARTAWAMAPAAPVVGKMCSGV